MPTLRDPRREQFAQLIANGMPTQEAYVQAGYKSTTPGAIHTASYRLRDDPVVSARIEEMYATREKMQVTATAKAVERVALSKEWVLSKLIENVERAMQVTPPTKEGGVFKYEGAVANRALELLGREMGMFIDRKEVGHAGEFAELDAGGVKQLIAQRLGLVRQSDGSFGVSGDEGEG